MSSILLPNNYLFHFIPLFNYFCIRTFLGNNNFSFNGSLLFDENLDKIYNFSLNKTVVHSCTADVLCKNVTNSSATIVGYIL